MSRASVPDTLSVLITLVGVTWRRVLRGRALWVSVVIASLPALLAMTMQGDRDGREATQFAQFLVLALLPPMFVASSIGEEIEDRTTTYLWSRPIPRWSVIVGKLIALAPLAMLLSMAGWFAASVLGLGEPPAARALVALAAGALAISMMSAGLATLVPRHGMALSIVYLVIFDVSMAAIPASIQNISIIRQVTLLWAGEGSATQAAITMAAIAGVWLAVALLRVRRLES